MNKRILIFSIAYHPHVGGAEIAVKEITDRLPEFEFDMVTLKLGEKDKDEEKLGNVMVYRVGGSKTLFPIKALLFARKLNKKRKFTHIWAIMANWAGLGALFFKLFSPKTKYILTLQEGDSLEYIKKKVWFIYPLFKKIFLKADVIQTISHFLAKWARSFGYVGEVQVIPNGVDVEKFSISNSQFSKGSDQVILITTSRLVKKNGVGDVIDALKFLPENFKFKILGTGPRENDFKLKIRNLKLEGRVEMLGFVDQDKIPAFLHQSDIFIRPSVSEGMGNSFVEAMAAGLPVIATPVGGITDFLFDPDRNKEHPPTGLFVNVSDPKDIARQVLRLTKDQKLRETLINNGKRLVREKYNWDLIAKQMEDRVFKL